MERGGRKIASSDAGASVGEMANEAAASAGDFEDVEAGDITKVFEDQAVPGAGGVIVSGVGVEGGLVPKVVISSRVVGR